MNHSFISQGLLELEIHTCKFDFTTHSTSQMQIFTTDDTDDDFRRTAEGVERAS